MPRKPKPLFMLLNARARRAEQEQKAREEAREEDMYNDQRRFERFDRISPLIRDEE